MEISSVILSNLLEILLSIILLFNMAIYRVMWNKINNNESELNKINESLNMILQRIFGVDKDSTDGGHIEETDQRFIDLSDQLESIAETQEEIQKQNKKDHKKVEGKINSIILTISEEEDIDLDRSDFSEKHNQNIYE